MALIVGYGRVLGRGPEQRAQGAWAASASVTDGSIRDIPQWASGFSRPGRLDRPVPTPWVHAESFGGEVRVAGMTVRSDDIIQRRLSRCHRDFHQILPQNCRMPPNSAPAARRRSSISRAARSFSLAKLKEALAKSAEIH